jgi:branched-chain amino acid transport system substrate-binding protein
MRSLLKLVVAGLMCLAAAKAGAESVKVGLIADFTGAFAVWGAQFQHGVDAYQAVYGKSVKGPDGKNIDVQFVYRDVASAGPAKSRQLAEELVLREKVQFLTGFDLSPQAMAIPDLITQAKIPTVIMNAGTASIVRTSPYFARVSFTVAQYTAPLGRWAARNGLKTAFVVVSDYAPGYDAETYFAKEFEAGGGKILGKLRTPQQELNYSTYLEQVLRAKPDAMFSFQPSGAPAVALVKAYLERGLKEAKIQFLGSGEVQQFLLPNYSDEIVGAISGFPYTETNTYPENLKLQMQLVKMYGERTESDVAAVEGWDGTALIYRSLALVGAGQDGLKYIEAMKGQKIDSPRGPISIDPETRDIIQNIYIRRVEKRDGRLVNIDFDEEKDVKDPWKIDNPAK